MPLVPPMIEYIQVFFILKSCLGVFQEFDVLVAVLNLHVNVHCKHNLDGFYAMSPALDPTGFFHAISDVQDYYSPLDLSVYVDEARTDKDIVEIRLSELSETFSESCMLLVRILWQLFSKLWLLVILFQLLVSKLLQNTFRVVWIFSLNPW